MLDISDPATPGAFFTLLVPATARESAPLGDTVVRLGPGHTPIAGLEKVMEIRFPADWLQGQPPQGVVRPMAEYRALDPLVWDLTARLTESGHSKVFLRNAAALLVITVMAVEAKRMGR